jgi:hypothetical protein
MAKQASDTTPPTWAKPNTMSILSSANASAKPPSAPSRGGGGLPQNKPR